MSGSDVERSNVPSMESQPQVQRTPSPSPPLAPPAAPTPDLAASSSPPSSTDQSWVFDPSVTWTGDSLALVSYAVVTERFQRDEVELEYKRFAHSFDYVAAIVVNLLVGIVTLAAVLLGMSSSSATRLWLATHLTSGSLLCLSAVVEALVCVFLPHDTVKDQKTRLYFHMAINAVAWLGYAVLECGVVYIADPYCGDATPPYATQQFSCQRAVKTSTSAAILGLSAFVRSPAWCWPLIAVAFVSQALAFASGKPPRNEDFGFRFAASFVWVTFCAAGNWHRDRSARQYFIDLVRAKMAHDETVAQRSELVSLLDFAIPSKLLPQLINATGDSCTLDVSNVVASFRNDAIVCVTAPVDFARIATTQRLQEVLMTLHALYTKFDDAADRMHVDRATVFGDQYLVTSGLLEGTPGNSERVCAFAKWQINSGSDFKRDVELHTAIVRGELAGRFSGHGTMHYILQGAALRRALGVLSQVPSREIWLSDTAAADISQVAFPLGKSFSARAGSDSSSMFQSLLYKPNASPSLPSLPSWHAPSSRRAISTSSVKPVLPSPALPSMPSLNDSSPMLTLYDQDSGTQPDDVKNAFNEMGLGHHVVLGPRPTLELPTPVRVAVSPVLKLRGVFESEDDEVAYQKDTDEDLILRAVDLFLLMFFLCSTTLVITVVERAADVDDAYADSKGADVAFFTMQSIVFAVSLWLFLGRRRITSDVELRPVEDGSFTNPLTAVEPNDDTAESRRGVTDLSRQQEVRMKITKFTDPAFGTAIILLFPFRIILVWLSLALLAVTSLIALQRSVITNAPFYLVVAYGFTAARIVLRRYPWYGAGVVAVVVTIVPLAAIVPVHIGKQVNAIIFVFAGAVCTMLCAFKGSHGGRVSFTAKRTAAVELEIVTQNEALLRRVIRQQVPPHVADRGLRALRRAVQIQGKDPSSALRKLTIVEFNPELLYLSLRILSRKTRKLFDDDIFTIASTIAEHVARSPQLMFLQALGDELTIGGPPKWSDDNIRAAASSAISLLRHLCSEYKDFTFLASASLEECCGAILGSKALRYRVFGVAMTQSARLLDAATSVFASPISGSRTQNTLVSTRKLTAVIDAIQDADRSPFSDQAGALISSGKFRWMVKDVGLVHVHCYAIQTAPT